MKIMSFNVLCGSRDNFPLEERYPLVPKTIANEAPDVFGVQEAHIRWMNVINEHLGDTYAYVGVGRDDGADEGEFSAVFYRRDKYNCLDNGTFWLSETPEVPSRSWETACIRICTWSILEEKATGRKFAALNTHLDHRSELARNEGIKLVVEKMKSFGLPVFCTGDFNAYEDSKAYAIMTESFGDVKYLAADSTEGFTYHGFNPDEPEHPWSPIDFIFVSGDSIEVKKYRIIKDLVDGKYPSDHYPVTAEVEFK